MNTANFKIRTAWYALHDIEKASPEMKLKDALSFSERLANLELLEYRLKCALAVLGEPLGADEHGAIIEKYKDSEYAIQWAIKQVANCLGWVICGPQADALKKLKEEINQSKNSLDGF